MSHILRLTQHNLGPSITGIVATVDKELAQWPVDLRITSWSPECCRLPGHFGGYCGNCKWRDHALKCSVRDDRIVELSDDDDNPGEGGGQLQIEAGATPENAIVLA